MGIGTMQEASERLLGWEQDWRKSCALENKQTRGGKNSTSYSSLPALLLFMLSYVAYFWHFLLKQKNTWSPIGSPAKLTLGKSCIWASLCFKLFVGLVAYIGPSFNFLGSFIFPWFSELKKDVCWYLHQACSPLWTFQGWSLILFSVRCECPRSLVPLLLSGQFPRNGNVIPAAGPKHASALAA